MRILPCRLVRKNRKIGGFFLTVYSIEYWFFGWFYVDSSATLEENLAIEQFDRYKKNGTLAVVIKR